MPLPDDREEQDAARRGMFLTLGAALIVVIVGGWLAYAMHDYLAREQCRAEGHRYCDGPPADTSDR